MLKDRFFYPFAIAFIAGIIWFAMSKADNELLTKDIILEKGFIVQNDDLVTLTASVGTSYTYTAATPQTSAFVTMRSNMARKDAPPSAGVFAALGPVYEEAFANQTLKITIRARQGQKDPLTYFDMGYFTADVGDLEMRKTLTPDWHNYSFEFTPKTPINDLGVDYLGIWPGHKGNDETMDVQFMKIEVIHG